MRILKTRKSFRKEFKRQLRYAIAAAVGFMIIFAWRDAILNATRSLVEKFVGETTVVLTNVLSALALTLLGVLIIMISSRLLREK